MKKRLKIVYLEWEDAATMSGWSDSGKAEAFLKLPDISFEIGFLVCEDKDYIVLAKAKVYNWRDLSKILKANIIKRIDL